MGPVARSKRPRNIDRGTKELTSHQTGGDSSGPDINHVKSWLEQIANTAPNDTENTTRVDDETSDSYSIWYPHGLAFQQLGSESRTATRKRHCASEDSAVNGWPGNESNKHQNPHDQLTTNESNHRKHKKARQQTDDELSDWFESEESDEFVFEKRPRRKTRPDRYETNTDKTEPQPKSKTEKRKLRSNKNRRHPIRSRRDVMRNFTSDAIPQTRLTVSLVQELFVPVFKV